MSQIFKQEWINNWHNIEQEKVCSHHHIKYKLCDWTCPICPTIKGYSCTLNSCMFMHGYSCEIWRAAIIKLQNIYYRNTGNLIDYAKLWHAIEDNALTWDYYKIFVNLLPNKPMRNNNYHDYNGDYKYSEKELGIELYVRKTVFDYNIAKQKHVEQKQKKRAIWAEKHALRTKNQLNTDEVL